MELRADLARVDAIASALDTLCSDGEDGRQEALEAVWTTIMGVSKHLRGKVGEEVARAMMDDMIGRSMRYLERGEWEH